MATVALIADVHANALALEAVLRACGDRDVQAIWCAGDVVGYNAMPRETIAIMRRRRVACVHGNHDLMVTDRLRSDAVGPRARRVVEWTRLSLGPDDLAWLARLPAVLRFGEHVVCVHAGIGDAVARFETDAEWRDEAARVRAGYPEARVCVCGHTHMAGATYVARDGRVRHDRGKIVSLDGDGIWFVNAGSVGEPRDGDPRASYALMDWPPRRVTFRRAAYDRARLAQFNATRLPLASDPMPSGLKQWLDRVTARITRPTP